MLERMLPQAHFFGYCLVTGQLYRAALMARDYLVFGCTERALWSVDYDFARWILPRLQAFRYRQVNPYNSCGLPVKEWLTGQEPIVMGQDEWDRGLDSAIWACHLIIRDVEGDVDERLDTAEKTKERDEGLTWLAQHLGSLWT